MSRNDFDFNTRFSRLLCDCVHGVGQVVYVVGWDSGHWDTSVLGQVNAEVLGQLFNLKIFNIATFRAVNRKKFQQKLPTILIIGLRLKWMRPNGNSGYGCAGKQDCWWFHAISCTLLQHFRYLWHVANWYNFCNTFLGRNFSHFLRFLNGPDQAKIKRWLAWTILKIKMYFLCL